MGPKDGRNRRSKEDCLPVQKTHFGLYVSKNSISTIFEPYLFLGLSVTAVGII